MTKMAIVDPSITGKGGHYLEYAIRVVHQAQKDGLTPIVGTHHTFKAAGPQSEFTLPVFRNTFWTDVPSSFGPRQYLLARYLRAKIYLKSLFRSKLMYIFLTCHFSKVNLYSERGRSLSSLWDEKLGLYSSKWIGLPTARSLLRLFYIWHLAKRAILDRLKVTSFQIYRFALIVFTVILLIPGFLIVIAITPLALIFLAIRRTLRTLFGQHGPVDVLANDLADFVDRAALETGDYIFMPTVGETEILAVAEFLRKSKLARGLKWRLLIRRDAFHGYKSGWSSQGENILLFKLKNIFNYISELIDEIDVKWYTDTEQLAEQYYRISNRRFHVLPIPTGDSQLTISERRDDFRFGYLGDARSEKGFQHLSEIWDQYWSWSDTASRDSMVVQSNFNIEGGDPESVRGMYALLGQPDDNIEFVAGPLESTRYRSVLTSCDALLLPYDPVAYASRSSGIFAEAIMHGIPVIVSGGSWGAALTEPVRQMWLERLENSFRHASKVAAPPKDQIRGQFWGTLRNCSDCDTVLLRFQFISAIPGAGLNVELRARDEFGNIVAVVADVVLICAPFVRLALSLPVTCDSIEVWISQLSRESNIVPQTATALIGRLQDGYNCGFGMRSAHVSPKSFAAAQVDIRNNVAIYTEQARRLRSILRDAFDDSRMLNCLKSGTGIQFEPIYENIEIVIHEYIETLPPLQARQLIARARWSAS